MLKKDHISVIKQGFGRKIITFANLIGDVNILELATSSMMLGSVQE